jgi:hypothetical protein
MCRFLLKNIDNYDFHKFQAFGVRVEEEDSAFGPLTSMSSVGLTPSFLSRETAAGTSRPEGEVVRAGRHSVFLSGIPGRTKI